MVTEQSLLNEADLEQDAKSKQPSEINIQVKFTQLSTILNQIKFKNQEKNQRLKQLKNNLSDLRRQAQNSPLNDDFATHQNSISLDTSQNLSKISFQSRSFSAVQNQLQEIARKQIMEERITEQLKNMHDQYKKETINLKNKIRQQNSLVKHYVVIEPDIENAKIKARIDNSISDKNLRIERENLIEMRNKWQNQIQQVQRRKQNINNLIKQDAHTVAEIIVDGQDLVIRNKQISIRIQSCIELLKQSKRQKKQANQQLQFCQNAFKRIRDIIHSSKCLPGQIAEEQDEQSEQLIEHLKKLIYQESTLQIRYQDLINSQSQLQDSCFVMQQELNYLKNTEIIDQKVFTDIQDRANRIKAGQNNYKTFNQITSDIDIIQNDEVKRDQCDKADELGLYVLRFFVFENQKMLDILNFIKLHQGAYPEPLGEFIYRNLSEYEEFQKGFIQKQRTIKHQDTSQSLAKQGSGKEQNKLGVAQSQSFQQDSNDKYIPYSVQEIKQVFMFYFPDQKEKALTFAQKFSEINILKYFVSEQHICTFLQKAKDKYQQGSQPNFDLNFLIKEANQNLRDRMQKALGLQINLFKNVKLSIDNLELDLTEALDQLNEDQKRQYKQFCIHLKQYNAGQKQFNIFRDTSHLVKTIFEHKFNRLQQSKPVDNQKMKADFEQYIKKYQLMENGKEIDNQARKKQAFNLEQPTRQYQGYVSLTPRGNLTKSLSNQALQQDQSKRLGLTLPSISEKIKAMQEIKGFKDTLTTIRRYQKNIKGQKKKQSKFPSISKNRLIR